MVSDKTKNIIKKVLIYLVILSIIGTGSYFFGKALYNAFNLKTGYTCKDNKCTESTVTNPDFATEADCKKECEYKYYCNRGDNNENETVAGKCELDLTKTKSPSYFTKSKCDTECSKVKKQYWKCKEETDNKTCISTYSFDKLVDYPYTSQDACTESGCSNPLPAQGTCCPAGGGNDNPENCLEKSKDSCSTDTECIWKEKDTSCTMYRCTDETEKTCTEIKTDFLSSDYSDEPTCEKNCKPSPPPPPTPPSPPPPPFYSCTENNSDDAKCVIIRDKEKTDNDFDSLLSCQKECQPQNPAAKGRCLATADTDTQNLWNYYCLKRQGIEGGCGVMDDKGYLDGTCLPTFKDKKVVNCKPGNFWGVLYNDKYDHSINSYCDNFSKEQAECTNDFIHEKASYNKKDPPKSNDDFWLHSPAIVDLIDERALSPCEWHTPAGLCEGENIGNDCSIKKNEEDCNNSFITSNNFYNNICYWNGESCEASLQCQPKALCGNGKSTSRGKIKNAVTCSEQKKDNCYKHFEFDEDENKGYQCQYNENDEKKCSRGIECEINLDE